MMQVRIFTRVLKPKYTSLLPDVQWITDIGLEREINRWLVSEKGIDIKHITQSQSKVNLLSARSTLVVSVWYEQSSD